MSATQNNSAAEQRRRPRWRRVLKWSMLTLVVIVLLLAGLLAWVGGTRSGLDFAWSLLQPRLPAGIDVAQVDGRLIGPLTVSGIAVDTDSLDARIKRIHLQWQPSALLSMTIHIQQLAIEGVRYTAKPGAEKPPKKKHKPTRLPESIRLPVTLQLDDLSVQDVRYKSAADAEPFVVDRAHIAGAQLGADDWQVKTLAAHGPLFDVSGHATVAPHGHYQTGLALQAQLQPAKLAPIKASLTARGNLDKLDVNARVASPYNARLQATLANILATPHIKAQLKLTDTRLAAIRDNLPKVRLDTTTRISGTPRDVAVQLDGHVNSKEFGAIELATRLTYTPESIGVKTLKATRPDSDMRLQATGTVALASGHDMDLTLDWQQLQWPLAGVAQYLSKQGQIRLQGPLENYELTGRMQWQLSGQTAGKLALQGSGNLQSFHLDQLQTHGGPGDIDVEGDVVWAPELKVDARVRGKHINPAAVVPNIPGDFRLSADIRAQRDDHDALVARVDNLAAAGTLRKLPLQLDGQLAYLGDKVNIDKLVLDYGHTHVKASGQAGWTATAPLALKWSVQATDLSELGPQLAGSLNTSGHTSGTFAAPNIKATLAARGIKYGDYQLHSADLDADVDWSGQSRSGMTLDVAGIDAAGQDIRSAVFKLNGTPQAHTANLDVDSDTAQLDLKLDGKLDKQKMVWGFTLKALQVAYGKLAAWHLVDDASGQLSAQAQRMGDTCLASGKARLCLQGQHDNGGSKASVELKDLAFAYAQPMLPDNLTIDGALSAAVDLALPAGGTPQAKVQLQTTAGHISADKQDGKTVKVLSFDPAQLHASLQKTALKANLDWPLADTGGIKAQFAVAPGAGSLSSRPLTGEMHLDVKTLDFVSRIVDEVTNINGHIDGDMRIGGTLATPQVKGQLAMDASRIELLSPGLVLTGVNMTARGRGDAIDLAVAAQSGGGKLTVKGGINFAGNGPAINLNIGGKDFQAANTPMVRAWISPDLDVAVTPKAVKVNGSVVVPKARITPKDLPAAGVDTVSGDAEIVDNKQSVTKKAARAIAASVKVTLGDVRVDGFGLKTGINGTLQVEQNPGDPATGTGKLSLTNGSYRAYGQDLDIQSGDIYFAGGPLTNPGIELRAARYPAEDVTVGVEVHGSVEKPTIRLFSDPSMSQADILSWLLLGRSLDGTTGAQASLVARAALALGGNRSNKILGDIGNALGLDNVGIGSAAGHGVGETALMVGKYLTPRLYVSYGVGLFNSVSTLSLRYTLNSHWKLTSQSSNKATGGDIIYTFDR